MLRHRLVNISLLITGLVLGSLLQPFRLLSTEAQGGCQTFNETGKTVCGRFLDYWKTHGGLAQQGYPITNEFQEVSDLNGQTYTVQYFERAVFEKHPENAAPNDVLLSQLGTFQLHRKYPNGDPSGGQPPTQPTQPPSSSGLTGQTFQIKDFGGKVTFNAQVTDSKEMTKIPKTGLWDEAVAKGKFVLVKINVSNATNESQSVSTYGIRLKDSKGRLFDTVDDINAALVGAEYMGGKGPGTTVQPSFSETVVFVYDVAADSTGYTLVAR